MRIIGAPQFVLDIRCVALFRNQSASRRLRSKIEPKFRTFYPCEVEEGVVKMSESIFHARPMTKLLIYFWRGTDRLSGRYHLYLSKYWTTRLRMHWKSIWAFD